MDELKRCPFCGGKPVCVVEFYESAGFEVKLAAVVKCGKCRTEKRKIFKGVNVPFEDYETVFEGVKQLWNTRVVEESEQKE